MNPIEKIKDLERRVAALEKAAAGNKPGKPKDNKNGAPAKQGHHLVKPLSDESRDLALFAWATLVEGRDCAKRPVTQLEWLAAIDELDTDKRFPSAGTHMGETLRALLAEEAGLFIRYSTNPLLSANESAARKSEG